MRSLHTCCSAIPSAISAPSSFCDRPRASRWLAERPRQRLTCCGARCVSHRPTRSARRCCSSWERPPRGPGMPMGCSCCATRSLWPTGNRVVPIAGLELAFALGFSSAQSPEAIDVLEHARARPRGRHPANPAGRQPGDVRDLRAGCPPARRPQRCCELAARSNDRPRRACWPCSPRSPLDLAFEGAGADDCRATRRTSAGRRRADAS